MSEIRRVARTDSKPVLALGDTGYEISIVNDNFDKLTTYLEYVDSNVAFGTMTSEKNNGRYFDQRYCLWIAENDTPTAVETHIKNLDNFNTFSSLFIAGSALVTAVGAFFSLWSLFFFPLMLIAYFGFIRPRKPTVAIGLDSSRRIELGQQDFSLFDADDFKKVLVLPNAGDFTEHVMRMVNMIGVKKINKKYFLNWLNVAVKIMLADEGSSPSLIPYGLEDAQAVLTAMLEHNRKVKVKEARERARERAEQAIVENRNADMTEKQIAEHSAQTKEIALARVRSLDRQIFGEREDSEKALANSLEEIDTILD